MEVNLKWKHEWDKLLSVETKLSKEQSRARSALGQHNNRSDSDFATPTKTRRKQISTSTLKSLSIKPITPRTQPRLTSPNSTRHNKSFDPINLSYSRGLLMQRKTVNVSETKMHSKIAPHIFRAEHHELVKGVPKSMSHRSMSTKTKKKKRRPRFGPKIISTEGTDPLCPMTVRMSSPSPTRISPRKAQLPTKSTEFFFDEKPVPVDNILETTMPTEETTDEHAQVNRMIELMLRNQQFGRVPTPADRTRRNRSGKLVLKHVERVKMKPVRAETKSQRTQL